MEDFLDKKITLGSFAKLHNVNKKTLIYYDEIGLFSPNMVADNGYRYYDFKQNFTFSIINMLRSMKVSLSDIKILLELYDHGTLIRHLYKRSRDWERQLFELLALYDVSREKLFASDPIFIEDDMGKSRRKESEHTENEQPLISRFMDDCYKYRLCIESARGSEKSSLSSLGEV